MAHADRLPVADGKAVGLGQVNFDNHRVDRLHCRSGKGRSARASNCVITPRLTIQGLVAEGTRSMFVDSFLRYGCAWLR